MRLLLTDPGWRWAAWALAWLGGVALQMQQARLSALTLYVALTAAAAMLLLAAWRAGGRWRACMPIVALALLGFGSTGWRADARLDARLPAALEGVDLLVDGVVDAMPQVNADGTRFMLAVQRATRAGEPVPMPETISLAWYRGWFDEALLAAAGTPETAAWADESARS